MIISNKTLDELALLICEKTEYRKGSQIISFFNHIDYRTFKGLGFGSRIPSARERLSLINGKAELDICIRNLFAPINFVGRLNDLSELINEFNEYLRFDGFIIEIQGKEVIFKKADKINIKFKPKVEGIKNEESFLEIDFGEINIKTLKLESSFEKILNSRITEIKKSIQYDLPLSTIFLCGSTLEGLLFGISLLRLKEYNQARSVPKDKTGLVKKFNEWTLSDFINVSFELKLIKEDAKEYSSSMRNFRNYIHPYHQMLSNFEPDVHTAKISWQVLKAVIFQLSQSI